MKNSKTTEILASKLTVTFSVLALTASLLAAAGCKPKTPPPPDTTASTSSAVPGQSPVNIKPEANEPPEPAHAWTDQQILTCTVSQCWHLANQNEDGFFDIVQQLAAISAKNRDLTLPDSEQTGQQAGEIIKAKAKADHEQLLFAIVDDAVRQVGKPAPASSK